MSDEYPEDDVDFYRVGPFFDSDGEEIIPVGDEAVEVPLDRALGRFLVRSLDPELNGRETVISGEIMTRFIQQEWDRMWLGTPS